MGHDASAFLARGGRLFFALRNGRLPRRYFITARNDGKEKEIATHRRAECFTRRTVNIQGENSGKMRI